MAEKWTNTSSPVERWIKPYPFAPLNHFTVPFSLTEKLLSPHREEFIFPSDVEASRLRKSPPSKDRKDRSRYCRRKSPCQHEGLLSLVPGRGTTALSSGARDDDANFDRLTQKRQPKLPGFATDFSVVSPR